MKLTQFDRNGIPALGICTENGIVDVPAEAKRRGLAAPTTMLEAARMGRDALPLLAELADGAACYADEPPAPMVTGTDRIFCIGLNYRRHARECGMALPERPVLFNKFGNALAAHGQAVYLPRDYVEYDYEAELVVVMGKAARDVPEAEALDHVFGYTCGNDLSTRDLQFARGNQWVLSKTFDGFAPLGPCLVTADSLDPNNLAISSAVNGQSRQNSNTSDMIFSPAQIIADLSHHFTLQPGDLIFTGTPEGVMQGWPAGQKQWLRPGDRVDVAIEGIGRLTTTLI